MQSLVQEMFKDNIIASLHFIYLVVAMDEGGALT